MELIKRKLKLALPALTYMVIYLCWFYIIEHIPWRDYSIIHMRMDDKIPFCEYFIIPYILWFFFIGFTVLWFMFYNKNEKEYLQLIVSLMIGMTVFLFVSWIYPNGHYLRPVVFPRDNVFTDMVRLLYKTDTSTNILPSIHVYNSVAACVAVARCRALQNRSMVIAGTSLLTICIILATVFLKQHSVVDVVLAFALNFVVYLVVYYVDDHRGFLKRRVAMRSGII